MTKFVSLNLLVFCALAFGLNRQLSGAPIDTVLVCPKSYLLEFQPWITLRQQQGHEIGLVHEADTDAIRDAIRDISDNQVPGHLKYVVLGADVPNQQPGNEGIPAHFVESLVDVETRPKTKIATDNCYADLDNDGIPDLAVGRLSANSKEEVAAIVKKIVAYETERVPGFWKRRVNLVAGVGGFGLITDAVLERLTKSFVSNHIPASYKTSMTYASWRSPFCPDPRSFRNETLNRMNDGSLFWIYIGHGQQRNLDWVRVPVGVAPIFNDGDFRQVDVKHGAPIAIFLSCWAGAFDDPMDCLADQLLRQPNGPVSVICGSRETMPYAMAVMSNAMLQECFAMRKECLGDIFLTAKRKMVDSNEKGRDRLLLDTLAKALSPDPTKLREERIEHLSLMNLIGDPLLRIKHPQSVNVQAGNIAEQGSTIPIDLNCPLSGNCSLELVCQRGNLTFAAPTRTKFDATHEGMVEMDVVYEKAMNDRWLHHEFKIVAGNTKTEFRVPDQAKGTCFVRVFVEGNDDFAIGATKIWVRRKKSESGPVVQRDETLDKTTKR